MAQDIAADPFGRATMDEVQRWIEEGTAVVYDANSALVHARNHLPGARHASGDWAATLPGNRGERLVFYCSGPA